MSFDHTAGDCDSRLRRPVSGLVLVAAIALALAGCASDLGITTASAPPELDCPRSSEAVDASAKRMAALVPRIKAERGAIPATVAGVFGRIAGKAGDGTQAYADYERERLRGESVLAKAKTQGCPIAEAEKKFEDAKTQMAALRE